MNGKKRGLRGTRAAVVALAALMGLQPSSSGAAAQVVRTDDLVLDFTGRVQIQWNTTSVDAADIGYEPAETAFETRRIRFGTVFVYDGWMSGKVEADLSGAAARLADGYLNLAFSPPFELRVGQFKKPFGLFELESSTKMRTIERGLRIRGLEDLIPVPGEAQLLLDEGGYVGRQIGAMAHGDVGRLDYAIGLFNGEGANTREVSGSKAWAARVNYLVSAPLVVGAAISTQPTGLSDGPDEEHGMVYAAEASWGGFRVPGVHAKAEAYVGDNALLATGTELPEMVGAHALVSWFAPQEGRVEGVEPVLRVSWADPDVDGDNDEGMLLTPGVNLYFSGRNRLMLNGDVYLPGQDGLDPEVAVVAQVQVYF